MPRAGVGEQSYLGLSDFRLRPGGASDGDAQRVASTAELPEDVRCNAIRYLIPQRCCNDERGKSRGPPYGGIHGPTSVSIFSEPLPRLLQCPGRKEHLPREP